MFEEIKLAAFHLSDLKQMNKDAQRPLRSMDGARCLPEEAEVNEPAEQQREEFRSVFR